MKNLDYGVIGNCRTAALVSRTGSIDWLCLPDFDSPSVFTRLLDEEKGGCFAFQVSEEYRVTQSYLGNTNILVTRFESVEGEFVVMDYMPRYRTSEQKYYLPPEVHRYLRVVRGRPRVRILYDPKMNYAGEEALHTVTPNYIRTSSVVDPEDKIYLYSSVDFNTILNGEEMVLTDHHFFLLSYNQKLIAVDLNRVAQYERTGVLAQLITVAPIQAVRGFDQPQHAVIETACVPIFGGDAGCPHDQPARKHRGDP